MCVHLLRSFAPRSKAAEKMDAHISAESHKNNWLRRTSVPADYMLIKYRQREQKYRQWEQTMQSVGTYINYIGYLFSWYTNGVYILNLNVKRKFKHAFYVIYSSHWTLPYCKKVMEDWRIKQSCTKIYIPDVHYKICFVKPWKYFSHFSNIQWAKFIC